MRILQLVRMAFLPRVYIFHYLLLTSLPWIKAFFFTDDGAEDKVVHGIRLKPYPLPSEVSYYV